MSTITVFKSEQLTGVWQVLNALKGEKTNGSWITARPSKYSKHEVFISYWYYEDVEDNIKRILSDEYKEEVVSFLRQNGKNKVLRRTYCFINLLTKTLEVYRGLDNVTDEIVSKLEKFLNVKFTPINLKSEELQRVYSQHAVELKQVMFKNIEGMMYEIFRGQKLENNEKFKQYLQKFPDCLRVISFRPNIKFLNGNQKYQVTLNGDKGTIKLSSNDIFQWRPRFEIRQLIFIIAATLGLLR